jgi:glutamate dehydrogenase
VFAKVRVFNPAAAEHGFESRHTIVQIVNDDMPFLVDFDQQRAEPPRAQRASAGPSGDAGAARPRWRPPGIRRCRRARAVRIADADRDRPPGRSGQRDDLAAALARVLAEVRLAVGDWKAMRQAAVDAVEDLAPARNDEEEEFLCWLEANHFTFLGHRRYRYVEDSAQPGGIRYEVMPGSALGILRRDEGPSVRGRAGRRRGDGADSRAGRRRS